MSFLYGPAKCLFTWSPVRAYFGSGSGDFPADSWTLWVDSSSVIRRPRPRGFARAGSGWVREAGLTGGLRRATERGRGARRCSPSWGSAAQLWVLRVGSGAPAATMLNLVHFLRSFFKVRTASREPQSGLRRPARLGEKATRRARRCSRSGALGTCGGGRDLRRSPHPNFPNIGPEVASCRSVATRTWVGRGIPSEVGWTAARGEPRLGQESGPPPPRLLPRVGSRPSRPGRLTLDRRLQKRGGFLAHEVPRKWLLLLLLLGLKVPEGKAGLEHHFEK